jgi:hypothetical protein
MTQLAGTDTAGDLAAYRARESALYLVREALEASEKWDAFVERLEARGMGRARLTALAAAAEARGKR